MQFGLLPSYVLDEIQTYEIMALMRNSHYRHKENWEQARLISYLIAQTHSSKKLKVEDIVKFSWEQEDKSATYVSNEDIERLQKQAEELEKLFAQQ